MNFTVFPPPACTYSGGTVSTTQAGICYLNFPIVAKPVTLTLVPSNGETAFSVITPPESAPGVSNPPQVCSLDRATGVVTGVDAGTCEVIFETAPSETVSFIRESAPYVDTMGLPDSYSVDSDPANDLPISWYYRKPSPGRRRGSGSLYRVVQLCG